MQDSGLKFQECGGRTTATFHNILLCQFPTDQGGRFEFPWTVCPSWLSWAIGGAYNEVESSDKLKELIELRLEGMSRQRFVRNMSKFSWEYGPVSSRKISGQRLSLPVVTFGPLPLSEDDLKENGWGWVEEHLKDHHKGVSIPFCPRCREENPSAHSML